ncbi:alpha/beta hydrolase [Spirulina sp. CS-785/01]|uniref:alpha/beta hydrolase n=1 Tax=Spirulina sp. CS-785/01 TaxID=3021716 RepID=UPI0023312004|nr:alpha/beta hydrolase [Spirulina sp. CS-785/01]MDB9312642.1 alpha/beta hydrolase [Spirulina sp. CS-785/01]
MALSLRSKVTQVGMCLLGAGSSLLLSSPRSEAADQVVLTYGPIQETISVEDFVEFAETGEQSNDLQVLLGYSGQDPEMVQQFLTSEVGLDFLFAHDVLNTIFGEYALFEMGDIIHTKSKRANIQSLRGGILMSLSDDGRISLLEFFQNYPLEYMYVDGQNLARVANDVNRIVTQVLDFVEVPIAVLRDLLGSFICECEPPTD